MTYVTLTLAAIWQRNLFCATLLVAGMAVAFLYTMFYWLIARGETQARAVQWGAGGSLGFVGVCLALWLTSVCSDGADFELSFGAAQLRVADGSIVVCDHLGNLEVIDLADKLAIMYPMPRDKYGLSLPGMSYRYIAFAGAGQPIWSLSVSLLVPVGLAMLATIFVIGLAGKHSIGARLSRAFIVSSQHRRTGLQ